MADEHGDAARLSQVAQDDTVQQSIETTDYQIDPELVKEITGDQASYPQSVNEEKEEPLVDTTESTTAEEYIKHEDQVPEQTFDGTNGGEQVSTAGDQVMGAGMIQESEGASPTSRPAGTEGFQNIDVDSEDDGEWEALAKQEKQEEQAENDVLETFQVASARELWNWFNAQPGSFNEHMGDEEVLSVLAEGQLQSQGGGEIPQMSSSELRRAAMQAVQCSRPVDQTAAYAKWIAKGASGTKGKVTTEEVPSLQQRDYKKRTIDQVDGADEALTMRSEQAPAEFEAQSPQQEAGEESEDDAVEWGALLNSA